MIGLQFSPVKEFEKGSVDEDGLEYFGQIQSQGKAPGARLV
jgi:hypothetical protein